jgi:hypothetical protein
MPFGLGKHGGVGTLKLAWRFGLHQLHYPFILQVMILYCLIGDRPPPDGLSTICSKILLWDYLLPACAFHSENKRCMTSLVLVRSGEVE